jgi:hypothetical protein
MLGKTFSKPTASAAEGATAMSNKFYRVHFNALTNGPFLRESITVTSREAVIVLKRFLKTLGWEFLYEEEIVAVPAKGLGPQIAKLAKSIREAGLLPVMLEARYSDADHVAIEDSPGLQRIQARLVEMGADLVPTDDGKGYVAKLKEIV